MLTVASTTFSAPASANPCWLRRVPRTRRDEPAYDAVESVIAGRSRTRGDEPAAARSNRVRATRSPHARG